MTDKAETELKARMKAQPIVQAFLRAVEAADPEEGTTVRKVFEEPSPNADFTKVPEFLNALDAEFAALSRPTQTADAVEALKDVLSAYTEYDQRLCCDGRECGCKAATLFEAIEHYFKAALSTSADSGDREEVEPLTPQEESDIVDRINGNPLLQPTPHDSGLADELEEDVQQAINDCRDADNSEMEELLHRVSKALRQPSNDGELLREAHTALVECGCTNFDLIARLDQGEG